MSSQADVFVGRQQIYDRDLNTFAYELLFRSGQTNSANVIDGDVATSRLLVNSLCEIGLEAIVGDRQAFVNFTRNFIVGKFKIPFDPRLIVIEVLESVEPDDEVIEKLRALREDGFTIALDDYVASDHRESLIELADIVKLDVLTFDAASLEREVRELKRFPVRLLAEKVETSDGFEFCKTIGFDYFQGYFLSRPQVIEGRMITSNQATMLQLLAKLRDPMVTFDEIVDLIKQDVSLALKLMRYVNSMAQGTRRKIDSVRQATIRLGLQKIRQIVSLMVMSGFGGTPKPVLETVLIRARMCELLGTSLLPESSDVCFTIGLFSTLDLLLGRPLEELLQKLPITIEAREAVLNHQGELGRLLAAVIAFEKGNWDEVRALNVDATTIQRAYLGAVEWEYTEARAAG